MQLVLLIEPINHDLTIIQNHLSGSRFRLVETNNYKKGFDFARSAPPNLILLGLDPKQREGVDTLIYLKKESITRDIPVLGLIKESNQAFVDYVLKVGISATLTKPFEKQSLVDKVQDLLSKHEIIKSRILNTIKKHASIVFENDFRVMIEFRSGLKQYVLPEIRGLINYEFVKRVIPKHVCIDIRQLPEMTSEEVQILEKILHAFGEKRIALVTGSHLGNLMKNSSISDTANLFLSLDDYEIFLENPELDE
jgi:CheY-like chemotaxis protein